MAGTPYEDGETPLGFVSAIPIVRSDMRGMKYGSFAPLRGAMPV